MSRKLTIEETGPQIEQFLQHILGLAGFDLEFEVGEGWANQDFETPDIVVRFAGEDVDLLLANKAELLLALEHLTTEKLHLSSEEHSLLCFDANDYRLLRIEELRMSAMAVAEKVIKSRVPYQFNPMNSRERRIIHLALRNQKEIRSESIGQGPMRHVVILPADMPSLPEPPPQPMMRRSGPPRGPGGPGGPGGRGPGRGPGGDRDRRGPGAGGPRRGGPGGPRRDDRRGPRP